MDAQRKDWIREKLLKQQIDHAFMEHSLFSIQEDEKESSLGVSSKFTPEFNPQNWMTLINSQNFTPLNKRLLQKFTPNTDIKKQKNLILFN